MVDKMLLANDRMELTDEENPMEITLEESRKIYAKQLKLARRSSWFEKLNFPCQELKGYPSFSTVANHFACALWSAESQLGRGQLTLKEFADDVAFSSIVTSAWKLINRPFPLWCLSLEILQLFENYQWRATPDLGQAGSCGIIMLPEPILNPEGEKCEWVCFENLREGKIELPIQLGQHLIPILPAKSNRLRWTTMVRSGCGLF